MLRNPIIFLEFVPLEEMAAHLIKAQEENGWILDDDAFPTLLRTDRQEDDSAPTAAEMALVRDIAEILIQAPFQRQLPMEGTLTSPDGRLVTVTWPVTAPVEARRRGRGQAHKAKRGAR